MKMEKKDKAQKEMEKLTAQHGYQGASLKVLIQIRNELRKLNKKQRLPALNGD